MSNSFHILNLLFQDPSEIMALKSKIENLVLELKQVDDQIRGLAEDGFDSLKISETTKNVSASFFADLRFFKLI